MAAFWRSTRRSAGGYFGTAKRVSYRVSDLGYLLSPKPRRRSETCSVTNEARTRRGSCWQPSETVNLCFGSPPGALDLHAVRTWRLTTPGLCASAILQDDPWIIEDARLDSRALSNPLVVGELGLQFYAGIPLHTRDGYNLGTLCIIDRHPRTLSHQDLTTLEDLAAIVMHDLEQRMQSRQPA